MPLLEETGYVPTRKFSDGYDIQAHCRRIATQYGLYDQALFHTLIKSLRWDERISRWHVVTDRGDDIRARFVIMCGGPLNRPKLPGIPGLAAFKGKVRSEEHTSELQSLMRISYAVFCLKKKKKNITTTNEHDSSMK